MVRRCVHGEQLNECPVCKDVRRLIHQNSMSSVRMHSLYSGMRHSNLRNSIVHMEYATRLYRNGGHLPLFINDSVRRSAREYIRNPTNSARQALVRSMNHVFSEYNSSNSSSNNTTSTRSVHSRRTTPSVSARSVYSRMGTPDSPVTDRRVRSQTPVSRLRPRSPSDSNKNDEDRFSPKRVRKS
jgi:hypothetical protein